MWTSQVVMVVKKPPPTQETPEARGRSPDWEEPLEEGIATPPVLLSGQSHEQRSLADYIQPMGLQSQTWLKRLSTHACYTLTWV